MVIRMGSGVAIPRIALPAESLDGRGGVGQRRPPFSHDL